MCLQAVNVFNGLTKVSVKNNVLVDRDWEPADHITEKNDSCMGFDRLPYVVAWCKVQLVQGVGF